MFTTTTFTLAGLLLASIHQVYAQIPSEFSAGFQFATSQLVVSYPQTGSFSDGQTLSIPGVVDAPTYSLGRSQNIGAGSKFIVVMVSPDVPRRTNSDTPQLVHMIQSNLEPVAASGFPLSGTSAPELAYLKPSPGANSGTHRYIFLLYNQPTDDNFTLQGVPAATDRKTFDVVAWQKLNNLPNAIAGAIYLLNSPSAATVVTTTPSAAAAAAAVTSTTAATIVATPPPAVSVKTVFAAAPTFPAFRAPPLPARPAVAIPAFRGASPQSFNPNTFGFPQPPVVVAAPGTNFNPASINSNINQFIPPQFRAPPASVANVVIPGRGPSPVVGGRPISRPSFGGAAAGFGQRGASRAVARQLKEERRDRVRFGDDETEKEEEEGEDEEE